MTRGVKTLRFLLWVLAVELIANHGLTAVAYRDRNPRLQYAAGVALACCLLVTAQRARHHDRR